MVESLTAKVKAWELDKGVPFLYDKVINETVLSLAYTTHTCTHPCVCALVLFYFGISMLTPGYQNSSFPS